MSNKKKKEQAASPEAQTPETTQEPEIQEEPVPETPPQAAPEGQEPLSQELEALREQVKDQEDKFLRLCAEYDNFRRRTQKEKENVYADATADAVRALLPVYDNLERALQQETADMAYKKGVEMTMAGLKKALESLGVTEIDAAGQPFDPNVHNAVMHVDDDTLGENTVAQVFQAGFKLGDKVIRFAMVQVAN